MPRAPKPFFTRRRNDSKTFLFSINETSGLPRRVCLDWQRRSFQDFPASLAQYRMPKNKSAADAGVIALIQYLKNETETVNAPHVRTDEITVGAWLEKFTSMDTSPRTARNAARNRPYSPDTLETYKCFYDVHIKDDPIAKLKMKDIEDQDALEFSNRMSLRKKKTKAGEGEPLGGTRTYAGIIMFVRMTFKEYQRTHHRWYNPFTGLDSPVINKGKTDALSEDEVVKLFSENIFTDTLEFAICAVMFLSGLRRSEILALKPESLDWNTPKITVKNSWQRVDRKDKAYGPTKSKKERDAPFDPVLQGAIKKLWAENGRHKFVFCRKDGSTPGSSWIYVHFKKWLAAAKIDTAGRKIVPHSSRHSLASLLEARGIPLRYIQDLLGHYDLETTMGYLHSPNGTIRVVGQKITEAMEKGQEDAKNIIQFKTS